MSGRMAVICSFALQYAHASSDSMALWGKAYSRSKAKARERWKLDASGLRTLIFIQIATGAALLLAGELTVSSTWARVASVTAPLLLYPFTVLWYLPGEASEIWRESVVERQCLAEALRKSEEAKNSPSSTPTNIPAIATGGRYTIVVAGLGGDNDDKHARYVVRSLRDFSGVSVHRIPDVVAVSAFGDVEENTRSAQRNARELVDRYNGDVIIWGDVLKTDGLLDLHISARDELAGEGGEYTLDSHLRLPADFGQALAGLLFICCLTRILPLLRSARVGAAEDLARETERLRFFISNTTLADDHRLELSKAFSTSALTIFECTGDHHWLSFAMNVVEDPTEATPDEITFHARLWLAAAEQMPLRELTMTAMSWLDKSVAAYGKPRRIHWFLSAWGLRLLSRLEEEPAQQEALLENERQAWGVLAGFLPSPSPNDDIAHATLGSRRESAVTRGDLDALSGLVAEHGALRPAVSPRAMIEHMQTLVEHGVEVDDTSRLAEARCIGEKLAKTDTVQQSAMLADLVRALIYRSRIPEAMVDELREIEAELDDWKPISNFNVAMRGIAQAELHLRLAPHSDTQLDELKELKLAQVGALLSQKVIHFKDFHVIERLAKRRYDTAGERFDLVKGKAQASGQGAG